MAARWYSKAIDGRSSHEDWAKFFGSLSGAAVGEVCADALAHSLGVAETLNFYAAAIERLRDMAWLAVALTKPQRDASIAFSDKILDYVDAAFSHRTEELQRLHIALAADEDFYRVWGDENVRQWLFDRGFYDELGVQLHPIPRRENLRHPASDPPG